MKKHKKTHKYLIIFLIFILTALPIFIFEFFATESIKTGIERVIVQSTLQIGGRIALSLRTFIVRNLDTMKNLANSSEIRNLNGAIAGDILDFYRTRNDSFEFLTLVDIDGGYVASSGIDQDVQAIIQNEIKSSRLEDVESGTGKIILGETDSNMYPVWSVVDDTGNSLGFVIGKFRMRKIKELIDSNAIGTTEKIFLTSKRFKKIYGTAGKKIDFSEFMDLEYGSYEFRHDNEKQLITLMPVIGHDLNILIMRGDKEVFKFIGKLKFDLIIWLFLGIILTFLSGFYISKRYYKIESKVSEDEEDVEKIEESIDFNKFTVEILEKLNYSKNTDELLKVFLHDIVELLKIERASVMLRNIETDELELRSVTIFDQKDGEIKNIDFIKRIRLFSGEGIAGLVSKDGQAMLISQGSQDDRFLAYDAESGLNETIKSLLVIPLKIGNQSFGVINLVNPFSDIKFSQELMDNMSGLGEKLGIMIEKSSVFQAIATDSSTGLYTEQYFKKSLEIEQVRCRRFGMPVSIMITSVDNLKEIEEKFDKNVSKIVFKEFSRKIEEMSQKHSSPCLYKNDNEIIQIINADNESEVRNFGEEIRSKINSMVFETGAEPVKLQLSIGFVCCNNYLVLGSELLKKADDALRFSIKKGGNRVTYLTCDDIIEDHENEKKKDENTNGEKVDE